MRTPTLRRLLLGAWLVAASASIPAAADPFGYAQAARESAPLPARYTSALPAWFEPEPSFGTWRRHIDTILDGPTHLQWRLCRGDAAVQDRVLDAVRRSFAGPPDDYVETWRQMVLGSGCGAGTREEMRHRCAWLRRVAPSEPDVRVRETLFWQLLICAGPGDLPLFERAETPDGAVLAFHRDHGPFGWSERLAAAVRTRFTASDPRRVEDGVAALSRIDDPRVSGLLLALRDETDDPALRRTIALGLVHQSDPTAFEVFRHEWRLQCEARRDAIATGSMSGGALHALGYVAVDTQCEADALRHAPPPESTARKAPTPSSSRPDDALRASLARLALDEGLLSFSPDGAELVGAHAPLMRRMIDLVAPDLDDVVLEEVWPALDAFAFERGPVPGFTTVDRLGFKLGVRDERDVAQISGEIVAALAEPHWVDAYVGGSRFRFALRPLGRRFDVETVVGALNQLLELRGSEQRFVLLAPDGWQTRVFAGPRDRLLEAIRAGVVRPAPRP